jgi:hypothetical protein
MDFARESQGSLCYADPAIVLVGERKRMKKVAFLAAGIAALGLSACNSNNQDAVNNAELNQPAADSLNQLSTDAANDAAAANEAASLRNQQAQLNSENAAAESNVTNPTDEQEQNVSGM